MKNQFKKIREGFWECLICGKNTDCPECHICYGKKVKEKIKQKMKHSNTLKGRVS